MSLKHFQLIQNTAARALTKTKREITFLHFQFLFTGSVLSEFNSHKRHNQPPSYLKDYGVAVAQLQWEIYTIGMS